MDEHLYLQQVFGRLRTTQNIDCVSATNLQGGTNNRLYKIEQRNGPSIVVKRYFSDDRDRLNREYNTLTTLTKKVTL